MTTPRILFISNVPPLPIDDGTKMRVLNLLQSLAGIGEVDFFTLGDLIETEPPLPAHRVAGIPRQTAWGSHSNWRWLFSSLPYPWPGRDTSVARSMLRQWIDSDYDLVFYNRVETWLTFGPVEARAVALDFDILEPERILTKLASPASPTGVRKLRSRIDAVRWRRLEKKVAGLVDLALVCNQADAEALGTPNTAVIPNGYDDTAPAGNPEVNSSPPLVGMVAAYGYGPNWDAAKTLVTQVMPKVQVRIPDARLVLVGKEGERLEHLTPERPWLTITGWVDQVTDWLQRIDVMVLPVVYGGGTRIKVLEALCHRVPVVASPFTVAGLDVIDGVHVLLGRTPSQLAEHTCTLLGDASRRIALADAGRELFERSYTWRASTDIITRVMDPLLRK